MEENYNNLELKFFNATPKKIIQLLEQKELKLVDLDYNFIFKGDSPLNYKSTKDSTIYDLQLFNLDHLESEEEYMFFYSTKNYNNSYDSDFSHSIWEVILMHDTFEEFLNENDIQFPFYLHSNDTFEKSRSFFLEGKEVCSTEEIFKATLYDDRNCILSERYFSTNPFN